MQIRVDSTEYAVATVSADHDLTGKTIEVALPVTGQAPTVWTAAEVVGVNVATDGSSTATYRLLLGPSGTVTLAEGTYDWTVRITDTPEIPVRKAGTVTVTAI